MGGKIIDLTPTEYAILYLMIKNAGKMVTHRQILETIWGPDQVKSKQTILSTFIFTMRTKLELNPTQPPYLISESGVGYRLGLE